MTALKKLSALGQSCWMDDLTRGMIISGELAHRVAEEDLRGITSNPAIFEKAITSGKDYDSDIAELTAAGRSPAEIYEELVTADVRSACDILRPVYDQSDGRDGFVSLEVSPHLAHDTRASIEEAKRLAAHVGRPNLFIKIPGTVEGVPAVEELIFEGINVNITLLFAIESYEAVAQAYLRGLERRLAAGKPLTDVTSIASFFLSRIDTLADALIQQRIVPGRARPSDGLDPSSLLGKVAIANAKLAYQSFRKLARSERWQNLAARGARIQRMLWASTSTKNPAYDDLMYVAPLIGPHTVNTMPRKTIAALLDHGVVAPTLGEGVAQAQQIMSDLARLGIDFKLITAQLENEGIQKFIEPYDSLLKCLATRRQKHLLREELAPLSAMARKLRRLVIEMTTAAGSGHPTSCLSCADIVAALFFRQMRWDPSDTGARNVDHFVLSKGHAAPILWAALSQAHAITEDLLSLRRIDSTLEGHPTPLNPWVKVATGSLGQGLAAANGIALADRLDGIEARTYCLMGDGECSEGSVWEAAQFASLNRLANLVAIVDVNGLGQSEAAPYGHDTSVYARRFEAFGWRAIEIDGHDMAAVVDALGQPANGRPIAIVARTEKGKGVSFLEGASGWHGKALDHEQKMKALSELGDVDIQMEIKPRRVGQYRARPTAPAFVIKPNYARGELVATREAFGRALEKLGAMNGEIVALDGDVKNSTGTQAFAKRFPGRFFESYIAEQNMVGTALGLGVSGKIPFAATFACFLTRAYDFIRMAQYSRPPHLILCGSHAGISIGEDGPSQMGLEDIAMFRALIKSTVLYPCDAVSTERLTVTSVQTPGIVYLRTTRPKTAVIYDNDEEFPIGGSKILRASEYDRAAIIAAGVTVHEALAAHESLKQMGVATRVIDAYSIKPLDEDTIVKAARETANLLVVEDHALDGGLGDAVSAAAGPAAHIHRLAVHDLPRSGTKDELLDRQGISHTAIAAKVIELAA